MSHDGEFARLHAEIDQVVVKIGDNINRLT